LDEAAYAPVPLWKLDAASERIAPSLRLQEHAGRDLDAETFMFSRSERPATPAVGGLDVGSATIGCLLSILADRKEDDQ
jgi:hypothetical protein